MPLAETWMKIHKILIEEVLRICENEIEKGPRMMFRDPVVGGYGYLQPFQMFEYLRGLIEDREDQLHDLKHRNLHDATFYCGAESIYSIHYLHGCHPFDEIFLDHRCREFTKVLKQWVKNVNKDIKALEDPDAIVPWYIIRYVLSFYLNESKNIMKIHGERDPYAVNTKKAINHIRDGDYVIGCSVTKERCLWQIDVLRRYFITEGLDPSDSRYEFDNFQYYTVDIITRGHICMYWGNRMWSQFSEVWPRYISQTQSQPPRPTEPQPEQMRPVAIEPINPTKTHLTELLAMIEENQLKWNMSEGDYLELSKKMKATFDSV